MNRIEYVLFGDGITRDKFFNVLKEEAKLISLQDIMQASLFLVNDAKYVQKSYRKEYLKSYTSAFITRVKEIVGKKVNNDDSLDILKVKEAVILFYKSGKIPGQIHFHPLLSLPDLLIM